MANKWSSIADGVSTNDPFYNNDWHPIMLAMTKLVERCVFVEIRERANKIREIDHQELLFVSNPMEDLL